MRIELTLNGRRTALEAAPDEMLLTLLAREGLRSARETCGIGVCGACTVLLDGELDTACLTRAAHVDGLGNDPVQRAFVAHHAFQCGWCTPGFVLAARALLERNPSPSDEEIAEGLGGNLCRCGSYVKIAEAVRACAS
jgi:aerobic-type carbon monoxide dehydrogenase small subunit (CoxS/CutS family)